MSNPTTPFSWQMPTATDLVTDLPADFEVFGQAVATSMADLLGGTSGQILAKNSNTDMDFVWVTNDVGDITAVTAGTGISGGGTSGAVTITNSMATEITAKGDLIVGTGSATFDNLAAGADGSSIVADSSTSTGLRYQVAKSVNHVINGGMDIWQRGTSFASAASLQYTTDRFQFLRAGSVAGGTLSRQNTNDTTNLPNIQYCARVQRDSGNTSTAVTYFASSLESQETRQLQGQAVVLSFYARAGANYSAASSILGVEIISGTGTDQNIFSGFTGQASIASSKTLTTTWQRFTATATVPSTATQLCVLFPFTPVGTAGANDYYEITGVQLELGTVPTPFQRSGGTLQGETSACQRYYFRNTVEQAYGVTATGFATSSTNVLVFLQMPVQMRVTPTALEYANLRLLDSGFAGSLTNLTISANECSKNVALLIGTGTGYTAYRGTYLSGNNNAAGYVAVTAEL